MLYLIQIVIVIVMCAVWDLVGLPTLSWASAAQWFKILLMAWASVDLADLLVKL